MDRMMRRMDEERKVRNMSRGGGGMAHGDVMNKGNMNKSVTGIMHMEMPTSFFFASEVEHLIVENWTGNATLDFVIVVVVATFLAFMWQVLRRFARALQRKLGYYANLETQLVLRDKRRQQENTESPSNRPAYLFHNGRVFHQPADYTELLDLHQERQVNIDNNAAAQLQRQKQRNVSLLSAGVPDPTADVTENGDEDVFVDANTTQNTTVFSRSGDPRTLPGNYCSRTWSSRRDRNHSFDLGPNRWNSLPRTQKGYIGSYSKRGLKCYRFCYHFALTTVHTLRFSIGYILMLMVMTYNVWFLVAVVSGAALGYFVFSTDLQVAAARMESVVMARNIRQRRLENIHSQTL